MGSIGCSRSAPWSRTRISMQRAPSAVSARDVPGRCGVAQVTPVPLGGADTGAEVSAAGAAATAATLALPAAEL